jgi:DNA-binding MarR family transcriptional regulator
MAANLRPARRTRRASVSARRGDPLFYRGDDYRIDESIGYLLRQLRSEMDRAIDAEMSALDLTNVQWVPLLAIDLGLGDTAAELSRLARVHTGAMTRLLDRLQAKELLRRTPCPRDARVVRLELTPQGRRLARKIPYGLARVLNHLLRGFARDELELFKGLVRRMLANARTD